MADIFHHFLEINTCSSFEIVQLIQATHMRRHAQIIARAFYRDWQDPIVLYNDKNLHAPV